MRDCTIRGSEAFDAVQLVRLFSFTEFLDKAILIFIAVFGGSYRRAFKVILHPPAGNTL